MAIELRQLRESDDRTKFRSGHADLDRFFARFAGQNQFRLHIGTSYVAVDDSRTIVGYVTVEAGEIEVRPIPKLMCLELGSIPVSDDALPGT